MFLIVANREEMCFLGEGDIGGAGIGDSGEKK